MRLRTLKPGFFKNDRLAEILPIGRLLFQGLWCMADREGRLEDRPRKIKAEVLPYDDCDVDSLLSALDDAGFITRYESGGYQVIQVTNFHRHQNPHVKEGASTLPAPWEHSASTGQASDESGLTSDSHEWEHTTPAPKGYAPTVKATPKGRAHDGPGNSTVQEPDGPPAGTPSIGEWGIGVLESRSGDLGVESGESEGGAAAEPPTRAPDDQPRKRVTRIDGAFIERMVLDFHQAYGGAKPVKDAIEAAMGHKNYDKWNDKQRYVLNWLQRDTPKPPSAEQPTEPEQPSKSYPTWDDEIDPDADARWRTVRTSLQSKVTRPSYDTWLANTRGVAYEDGKLVIATPTEWVAEWLNIRMFGLIVEELGGDEFTFVVAMPPKPEESEPEEASA